MAVRLGLSKIDFAIFHKILLRSLDFSIFCDNMIKDEEPKGGKL